MTNIKKSVCYTRKFILLFILLFFGFVSPVYAVNVAFQWNPNTEPDIAGYRVFCREEGRSYNYNNPCWEGAGTMCTIYDLDETKTYYFVSRAFDTQGLESSNSNELYLKSGTSSDNQPPITIIAQDYIEANPGTTITLDGSNSTDADDGITSYLWTQVDGTSVSLSDYNSEVATFTAPETDEYGSNLTFQLTVTDYEGLQSTAICLVFVTGDTQIHNITITSATYIPKLNRLVIEALSDASAGSVTLTAWANYVTETIKLGELRYSNQKRIYYNTIKKIYSAPVSITVTSSGGASDTLRCTVK